MKPTSTKNVPAHKGEIDLLAERLESVRLTASTFRVPQPALGLLAALDEDHIDAHIAAVVKLHALSEGIESLLVADERFPGNEVKFVRELNGASGFYPHFVAEKLVRRVLKSDSVEGSIAWLQKVLATPAANGSFVTALWNVPVASTVQLTSEISLIPFECLPDSGQKKRLEMERFQTGAIRSIFDMQLPSSALVVQHRVDPFLGSPSDPAHDDQSRLQSQIAEAVLVLTLIGPRVPVPAAHWFNYDDPDLEFARLGLGTGGLLLEIVPRHSPEPFPMLDVAEAQKLIEQYQALRPQKKRKFSTATARLNRALARHQPGDRAVELSIALETLMGDTGTSEMTHKVSVRAVRLLGGTQDIRARNLAILKKTYAIRSKLVHQGEQDSKATSVTGVFMSVEAITAEACSLCAALIKGVIARGSLPQWSHFDIGDGAHPVPSQEDE